jgi:ABC-type nitrate/sulfonate/bicarbonate transport system substrate-binding protein
MKTLKAAGVPEHFNFPWHLALAQNQFSQAGIDLQWQEVAQGTGKMCSMLRDGEIDIAVLLTEGIVKDIVEGNPSKLVQVYVDSPLVWGIHCAGDSPYSDVSELKGKVAAISRLGSGSQLMAYVNASKMGWKTEDLAFEIVHTIDGAVKTLTQGQADYFMWEKFMTQPLVDNKVFKRVGECPTPWPCFVIAVRNDVLKHSPDQVQKVLDIVNAQSAKMHETPEITAILASKYGLQPRDVAAWLALTRWTSRAVDEDMLNNVQNHLLQLGLIGKKGTFTEIVKT